MSSARVTHSCSRRTGNCQHTLTGHTNTVVALAVAPDGQWLATDRWDCTGRDWAPSTGTTWHISLSDDAGEPSLLDQEKMAEQRVRADVLADPNVRAVMDAFPEAELESFSTKGA